MKTVCVLGLGYIGLPTASILATSGHRVIGVDVNARVIDALRTGEPHIEEPGLRAIAQSALSSGNLELRRTPEPADAFIIAVPTPLTSDKKPDMSYVERAAESIALHLRPGNLVILESTSPPGTTCDLVAPIVRRAGFEPGAQVFVAYCPERVLPGRILKEIIENDRVIGGLDRASAEKALELYGSFVEGEIFLTDATTAETVKIVENTYRDVNIALVNELSRVCSELGISVWDVIELSNRHPRVRLHAPGPGVGGHCLPVDPWFLVDRCPDCTRLIRASRAVNDEQPAFTASLIETLVEDVDRPKVALLGITYKADVDEVRESPTSALIGLLKRKGYELSVHDPHARTASIELQELEEALDGADCAVILVDHSQFRELDPARVAPLMRTLQLLDTKRTVAAEAWREAGFTVRLLGA